MSRPSVARVLEVCQEALAREEAERDRFLDEACAGDEQLRQAVEQILAEQVNTAGLLEAPAWTPRPRLAAGTRLGPYEIESFVGAGGMGEVYKGYDTRLGRTVAIKVLPSAVAADKERRARFELEAKTIAGLNHPNVCTLYDVGDQNGSMFLVMEYIEGETLAARLRRGPLPVTDSLRIAAQVADAIAAAHARGISHRDLKPANVMLTSRDTSGVSVVDAKLLDFGLAKLRTDDVATVSSLAIGSVVAPEPRTEAGRIVGTVPYMSPEQLQGRQSDARSDIFAFGALFYEMLTGKRAFDGDSPAGVITAILEQQPPPPSSVQPLTPPKLDHVVRRCLAKNPDERWQSASDIAAEVRRISGDSISFRINLRSRRTQLAVALVCCVAGAGIVWTTFVRTPGTRVQLIDLRPAEALSGAAPHDLWTHRPTGTALAISRDGGSIYFSAVKKNAVQIYVRTLESQEASAIAGTEGGDDPFLSPDEKWLAFRTGPLGAPRWRKVPVTGGVPTDISAGAGPYGGFWAADGRIFLGGRDGIFQIDPAGQKTYATRIDRAAGEIAHMLPQLLPDGSLMYTSASGNLLDGWRVEVKDSLTGLVRTLVTGAADARYVATGHLVYTRGGKLCARPFDLHRLAMTGAEVTLREDVMQALNDPEGISETGASQIAISPSGVMVFARGGIFPEGRHVLAWLGRDGSTRPLDVPIRPYIGARLSPDGKRAVTFTMGSLSASSWAYEFELGAMSALSVGFEAVWPMWSYDGRAVVFVGLPGSRGSGRMFRVSLDAPGSPEPLGNTDTGRQWPACWADEGRELVYVEANETNACDIWAMPVGQPDNAYPLVRTPDDEMFPAVSPDSRWLAYTSQRPGSGPKEVYVRPYRGGQTIQVSTGGGRAPAWSPNGRKLYWVSTGGAGAPLTFYWVDVAPGPRLVLGRAEKWYAEGGTMSNFALPPPRVRAYDVAPDGRLLIVYRKERPALEPAKQIEVVENWFAELKARSPVPR